VKVIVAIDQSRYNRQVLDAVLYASWPKDTSFKVITVVEPLQWQAQRDLNFESNSVEWQAMAKEVCAKRQAQAHAILQTARHELESAVPTANVHVELAEGRPGEEIVRAAGEWMADKIVVGAHGTAPNRLLGRVPQAVAREASCTVQIVRLKEIPVDSPPQKFKGIAASKGR